MRRVYHMLSKAAYESLPPGPYRHPSLETEGFVHCSNRDQVAWAANKFYAGELDMVVLTLDANCLGVLLKDEDPGCGRLFPHVYGPIERDAILGAQPLRRDGAGHWEFPRIE